MADMLPKLKLYFFIGCISLITNVCIVLFREPFDLTTVLKVGITSYIPLVDVALVAFDMFIEGSFLGFPTEINLIFLLVIGLLTAIKSIVFIVLIWSAVPTVNV